MSHSSPPTPSNPDGKSVSDIPTVRTAAWAKPEDIESLSESVEDPALSLAETKVKAGDDLPSPSKIAMPSGFDTPPTSPDRLPFLAEGTTIGQHVITGVLGRGGMGAVYRAHNPLLDRQVAIKLLLQAYPPESEELRRFLREARVAAKLHHPNCVLLHEIGQYQGRPYLVIEYVDGQSAQDVIKKSGPVFWREACRIMAGVAAGVQAAHEAKLIHRDIKPGNILLGRDGAVKLADFGLAKSADGSNQSTSLTGTGMVVGTPDYMSPEQCTAEACDYRTDIYSLGATLFALLAGVSPYGHHKVATRIMQAHCSSPVPDPRQFVGDIPASLVDVLRCTMAKQPSKRYATAGDVKTDLERILQGLEPVALRSRLSANSGAGGVGATGLGPALAPRGGQTLLVPGSGPGQLAQRRARPGERPAPRQGIAPQIRLMIYVGVALATALFTLIVLLLARRMVSGN